MREGPGCGPTGKPRPQREREAIRTEPSEGAGSGQRRHQADSRLFTLYPFAEGGEGGVKSAVSSVGAPQAIGPYSPALLAGPWLFISGQVPIDPVTGLMVDRKSVV